MDHLEVLREKIASLRDEIAQLKNLNTQYRHHADLTSKLILLTGSDKKGC